MTTAMPDVQSVSRWLLCPLKQMEFLKVVEEELRGLASEARRKHPVVQEAAERQAAPHTHPIAALRDRLCCGKK